MCARRLSRWRAGPDNGRRPRDMDESGGTDAAADLDPAVVAAPRTDLEPVAGTPSGSASNGADNRAEPVFLDIKEAAEGGAGSPAACACKGH